MYFFKQDGKQYLDLKGNLILSHNDVLIKARSKSISPYGANNDYAFNNITKRSMFDKFKITVLAIMFIWGKSQALLIENTNFNKPKRKGN